ncbi:MAG: class I SAM-dependent methyltransferase [Pseudomonadales bacterium]|nr:class I SAM-dependent methyltransferase [Pseudomonadales bacterium]
MKVQGLPLAMYQDLVPWYRLLDPVVEHEDEVGAYCEALKQVVSPPPRTLLELGAGAGHNGFYLKRDFICTLSDISEPMLALSRELNPECEHITADMRTQRLGREFDAVVIHDAIVYMTTEADLEAAAKTAFEHLRPGGAALISPDCLKETFVELSDLHEGDGADRAFRCAEWMWDPDPDDSTYTVDYAFLLRDASGVRVVHDRHVEGLFKRADWLRILSGVGFQVQAVPRPIDPEDNEQGAYCEEMFLCLKP